MAGGSMQKSNVQVNDHATVIVHTMYSKSC
jgi:hypothetical protein